MKTLYISDLDGTLLNGEAELSVYTIETMNALLKQGIHFSIATARTAATVTKILEPLDIKVPVVLMNGVLIYDIALKEYLKVHYISPTAFAKVIKILKAYNLTGFLYEIYNNTMSTYYERLDSSFMRDFYEERVNKYQKPFVQVADFSNVDSNHVIYLSLMDSKEHLDPVYQMLQKVPDIAMAYYKDIYSEEDAWYLEIFSIKATKYNAVKYLRSQYQYDRIIGFGDNLNDIPLFKACDEACAVANAKEEVKALATHIIESNQIDGVAQWLAKNVASHTNVYETSLGYIGITENGSAITALFFCKDQIPSDIVLEETPLLREASQQLIDYLQGKRTDFTVPLAPEGTAFQKKVWNALQTIPYGETWSYKKLAEAIGNPKACRAVGMANNKNPIAIIIPCHRVVGANGKLVGYAGGLDIKEQLLQLEIKN